MSELGVSLGMFLRNMTILVDGLEKEGWFVASATGTTAGSSWSNSPGQAGSGAGARAIAIGGSSAVRRLHARRTRRVAQAARAARYRPPMTVSLARIISIPTV